MFGLGFLEGLLVLFLIIICIETVAIISVGIVILYEACIIKEVLTSTPKISSAPPHPPNDCYDCEEPQFVYE
jgi:hypothetical protein